MVALCLDLDQSVGSAAHRHAEIGAARGLIGARPAVGPVTVLPAAPRPSRERQGVGDREVEELWKGQQTIGGFRSSSWAWTRTRTHTSRWPWMGLADTWAG